MIKLLRKKLMISIRITMTILMIMTIFLSSSFKVSAVQPFNVDIDLPDSYKDVNPGTDVWFTIELLNLANSQRVDVTLDYNIVDPDGDSIVKNSKTVAIETQASFVADLKLPEDAELGNYVINVVVSSSLGESSAKTSLKVSALKNDLIIYYIGAGILALILLVFLIIKSKPLIEKLKLKMKIGRIVKGKLEKH